MQTFKVGDRVKCVDPEHGLVLNATYTIKYVDGELVYDEEEAGYEYLQ